MAYGGKRGGSGAAVVAGNEDAVGSCLCHTHGHGTHTAFRGELDRNARGGADPAQIVDELIEELGAQQIPCLRVYNKSDLYFGDIRPHGEDSVNISAKTGEGVDELLARIDKLLDKGTRRVTIHLPYDKGGLLDMLYREAKVESVEYGETIDIVATCVPRVIGQVKDYIEGYREPKEDWEE